MPKKISFFDDKKKIRKKYIIYSLVFLFLVSSCLTFCISYYYTDGSASGTSSIHIPEFAPKVNGSSDNYQTINLASTIDNGKSLAPGARGKFKIDIDFTYVETDAYYRVTFDRTNIPNNIHFYVDENLTTELDEFEGIEYSGYGDRLAEHYIYWQWIYSNDPDSNQNDNLYMGQEIDLPFEAYISQRIDDGAIIVNDLEKPTGRIFLSGTEGSFNVELDFSNVSLINYVINFTKGDVPIHFYSDSSYTTEITNVHGIFDDSDNNTYQVETIYWRSDISLSNSFYYVVSLY